MKEVVAGWAAGYAMGIVVTVVLAYLSRPGGLLSRLREGIFPDLPAVGFAVPIFVGASLIWTMIGIVIGAVYRTGDFASRAGGAGSPSLIFTAGICLMAVAPLPALLIVARRDWPAWIGSAVVFAALFGWGMPFLAGL
ncbi:MAG: hypothetical protein ACE5EF_06915 [Dehalococcoidia bacterium]